MNQNGATVTLTDLTEGQYRFKLTVNGTNVYGEGFANVTVLPPQRINTPPLVLITPQTQTVKLPNTMAVLDGSASKVSIQLNQQSIAKVPHRFLKNPFASTFFPGPFVWGVGGCFVKSLFSSVALVGSF